MKRNSSGNDGGVWAPRGHDFLILQKAHLRDSFRHNLQNDRVDGCNTEEAAVVEEGVENRAAVVDTIARNELLHPAKHHVACLVEEDHHKEAAEASEV